MNPILYIGIALPALVFLWIVITFNRFVRQRNRMREAWSGVDVQLKRRHDLVPRLVECVQGYKNYESSVLKEYTALRTRAQMVKGAAEAGKVEAGVTQALRGLLAVVEAYPDLKAARNFQELSAALIDTEDQLQYAWRYYNGTIRDYAILAESFPSSVVARLFGFQPDAYFEVESSIERQAPEVKL